MKCNILYVAKCVVTECDEMKMPGGAFLGTIPGKVNAHVDLAEDIKFLNCPFSRIY